MGTISARSMLEATATAAQQSAPGERRRRLSAAALAVVNQKVQPAYSPIVIAGLVRLFDLVAIMAVGLSLYGAYLVPREGFSWVYPVTTAGIALTAVIAFQAADLYDMRALRGSLRTALRLVPTWALVVLLAIGVSFLAKRGASISRVWLVSYFVFGLAVLLAARHALHLMMKRWAQSGRLDRRTVIVGSDDTAAALIRTLEQQGDSGIHVLGVFDDRSGDRAQETCAGKPKLGKIEDIVEFARRTRLDLVLVSMPITAEERILAMLQKLWVLPVDIRLSAHTSKLRFRPRSYSYIGAVPTLDVFDQPITDWDIVMKAAFDRIVGGLLLIALAPLMAMVALAIKLDSPGPVLFRQKRYGFNNERIDVFKFRSLYHNMADQAAAKMVTKGDPRVTRVGRIIRKTSIDELPQLFNVVLKGNLSLVGPRPHAVTIKVKTRLYEETVDGYFARHRVKPGITGWAQIHGWRGETDTEEKLQKRVEYDLDYIENWSVLLDLYILLRTPFALLKTENAY